MKHTRIIQSTVALAALVTGSACSDTITAEPTVVALPAASPSVTPPAVDPPAVDPPAVDPAGHERTDVRVEIERERPTPSVPRPDLDLAFAPCGAYGPLADTASAVTTVAVDAVGDGSADDELTSYFDGGDWTLRLTTGGGVISEYDVAGVGPGFVEAIGAVQLDGGAGDQFLAVVGSNASNLRIGAFGADGTGCLVRFADPAGVDVEFMVGGDIGQLNGLACDAWEGAGYVESLSAVDAGDGLYSVYGTTWHKVGVNVVEAAGGTHLLGIDAEQADAIGQLDCPGIAL